MIELPTHEELLCWIEASCPLEPWQEPQSPLHTLCQKLVQQGEAYQLEQLQRTLAGKLCQSLTPYLQQLPLHRRKRIEQALALYIERCCVQTHPQKRPSLRAPRPYDAPQPLWDDLLAKLKRLSWDPYWQQLLQHASEPPFTCGMLASFATRALQAWLHDTQLPYRGSWRELKLPAWYEVSDPQIAHLLASSAPLLELTVERPLEEQSLLALKGHLPTLRRLHLESCDQLQQLGLSNAPQLQRLHLVRSKLPTDLWSYLPSKLLHLDLSESNLSDLHLVELSGPLSIRHLELERCSQLSHVGLRRLLQALPQLQSLNLKLCQGLHHLAFAYLPCTLKRLDLSWCSKLDDSALELLEQLPLESLRLSHCTGLSDLGIERLEPLPCLRELDLSYCRNLTPGALHQLIRALPLRTLNLQGHSWHDAAWQELLQPQLRSLTLPKVYDPQQLLKLRWPRLSHLNLGSCRHWKAEELSALLQLPELSQLKVLEMEQAGSVDSRALQQIARLKELRQLRLWSDAHHPQVILEGYSPLTQLEQLERLELAFAGPFDLHSLKELICTLPSLRSVELGPLHKIEPQEMQSLSSELPWLELSYYGYPRS